MTPEPQTIRPVPKAITAIGAGEPCPVVLVEVSGALGALFALRRCPGEVLEQVLYFRALMGTPYACFLESVELVSMDGYTVARAMAEERIFYEPSRVPYAMVNISPEVYGQFVNHIVRHEVDWVEDNLVGLFARVPGFSIDAQANLVAPKGYALGFDHFADSQAFIEPKAATRKGG